MTKWVLVCEVCGNKRILDVGYDLREFQRIYIYCRNCGENRPHRILGFEDEGESALGSRKNVVT